MHLKLIDFGSGKFYKDDVPEQVEDHDNQSGSGENKELKRMNTFIGTCEYMSPEIVKGVYVSNACDLWAIGVIVYKFFAEFSPFVGGFEEETLDKIMEEDPKFPEGFPEVAKDLCMKLLEKDPFKRLGAGKPGSENDIFALKSHSFFEGIDFDKLHSKESPIPKPIKRMSSLKERVIEKYKKKSSLDSTEQSSEPSIDPVVKSPVGKNKIEDWRTEKDIKIIHRELIKVRTKMYFIYDSVISLITDEPAFYIYNLKKGHLKERYTL